MTDNGPVFHTMTQCSAITGIPIAQIKRAKRAGAKCFAKDGRPCLYPLLKWIFEVGLEKSDSFDTIETAKMRDLNASAALKESKMKERSGALVQLGDAEKAIRETLLPVRQRLLAMPGEVAHLCNPADPAHARKALEMWTEANMAIMQNGEVK